jgi:hypothetical protein
MNENFPPRIPHTISAIESSASNGLDHDERGNNLDQRDGKLLLFDWMAI